MPGAQRARAVSLNRLSMWPIIRRTGASHSASLQPCFLHSCNQEADNDSSRSHHSLKPKPRVRGFKWPQVQEPQSALHRQPRSQSLSLPHQAQRAPAFEPCRARHVARSDQQEPAGPGQPGSSRGRRVTVLAVGSPHRTWQRSWSTVGRQARRGRAKGEQALLKRGGPEQRLPGLTARCQTSSRRPGTSPAASHPSETTVTGARREATPNAGGGVKI